LVTLAQRAREGDKTVLPTLQEALKDPALVDALGGDLARLAQQTLVDKFSGQNLLFQETLRCKLDLLREELSGPNPTPLERLRVERVVSCWLYLHHVEMRCCQKESMSLAVGSYLERSLSATQKRYLAAIKTLALVRKLAVPVLQVNIGRKQVNVAGPCLDANPAAVASPDSLTPADCPGAPPGPARRHSPPTSGWR
jgi:hypothetical protein